MVGIARTLSKGFPFVRVDLYALNDGSIKFGEMTFTTYSGIAPWHPADANAYMGSLIHLLALTMKETSKCRLSAL